MSDSITREEMSALFAKYFGEKKPNSAGNVSLADLEKETKAVVDRLKKSQPVITSFNSLLTGQKKSVEDLTETMESFDKALDEANKTLDEAEKTKKIAEVNNARAATISAARSKAMASSFHNAAVAGLSFADSMIKNSFAFAKELQSGASGLELGTQTTVNTVKAAGKTMTDLTGIATSLGTVFSLIPGPIGLVARGLTMLSMVLGAAVEKATEYTEQGLQYLGDELKNTQKSFVEINSAGAILAGGMTELREEAANAGLYVSQFSAIVKSSQAELALMGLGIGEAAKRIGGVSKELRNSELGMQLRKLGYTAEEQSIISAQVFANLSASGKMRVASDKDVAAQTVQYAKDLKVLATITGEDAKKKMDEARAQAMEADLLARAQAKGGNAFDILQKQLATLNPAVKKYYMEMISTGGVGVDAATSIYMTQNPKLREQLEKMLDTFSRGAVTGSAALDETAQLNSKTAAYARENLVNTQAIAIGTRLTGDATLKGVTDIANAYLVAGATQKEGATEAARLAAENAALNNRPLDLSIAKLDEDAQRLRAALSDATTGAITKFAETMRAGIETVDAALKRLGIQTSQNTQAKTEPGWFDRHSASLKVAGGAGLMAAGTAIGTASFGLATPIGLSVAAGGASMMANGISESNKKGWSTGGISTGPASGHAELLHGTELIVPLSANGDIKEGTPGHMELMKLLGDSAVQQNNTQSQMASMQSAASANAATNLSELVTAMTALLTTAREQIDKQDEMIRVMADNRDNTERLYHAMS